METNRVIIRILFLLMVVITVSCNKVLQLEKKLDGEWNIISITNGYKEIKNDFSINVIDIRFSPKGGFLPSRINYNYLTKDTELKGYTVFKSEGLDYVILETKNDFFRDTFEIATLTEKEMVLKNKEKEVRCERMGKSIYF